MAPAEPGPIRAPPLAFCAPGSGFPSKPKTSPAGKAGAKVLTEGKQMIIGKFTDYQDPETGEISYRGGISFAGVDLALRIEPNDDRKNENSPAWLVNDPACGKYAEPRCGVGFVNTTNGGDKYIGLRIETTKFGAPIECAMFGGRAPGEHIIVFNPRPKPAAAGEGGAA